MHGEVWTPEIDALITELRLVQRLPTRVIAARAGRTVAATSTRLLGLGVTIHDRKEWSEAEILDLSSSLEAGSESIRAIARRLVRSECSVRWKIDDLGIRPERIRRWTPEEDARVLACAGDDDLGPLAIETGRSVESVRARLRSLGVRRVVPWSEQDDARLRLLAGKDLSAKAIGDDLGRSQGSVYGRARVLDVTLAKDGRAWQACEDDCLRETFAAFGGVAGAVDEMVRLTARPRRSVAKRLKALGLVVARVAREKPCMSRPRRAGRVAKAIPAAKRDAVSRPAALDASRIAGTAMALNLRPSKPKPVPAVAVSREMEDAIARFIREKGVTVAGAIDPERETVRLVRARGYAVTGSADEGFLVDGRLRLGGVEALREFAALRGIPVPATAAVASR